MTKSWVICRERSTDDARVRLFCFHHAGGSAATYRAWSGALKNQIEICAIQTPGREELFALPRYRSIAALTPELIAQLRPWLAHPFAFFGHSLGALVAFAAAHALRDARLPLPSRLFLSGCRPPHLPRLLRNLWSAPDAELIGKLRELGSESLAALENLELRELMLPVLRDDLHMADSYDYEGGNPLPCPLSVFAGADDAFADPEALLEWKRYTLAAFRLQVFPGGHFFIQKYQKAVLEAVRQDLEHSPCDLNHF